MRPCVIFDLDGTLADTSGDLIAAANHCFAGMGESVRLDPVADAGIALRGGRRMLTEGLTRAGRMDEDVVNQWYPELLTAYGAALDVHTRLYDGCVDSVQQLRASGYAIGVCTNKPEALAERLLTQLGVRDLFASLIGADTLPVRKPNPAPFIASIRQAGGDPARACLVGDSDTDRKTAAAAGLPCILVTFPPGNPDIAALRPEGTVHHLSELPAEVARLIGAA